MIFDKIEHADIYLNKNEYINKAIKFLQTEDLNALAAGRHEIDGDNVFALVLEYDTHPLLEGKWEAHRKYYDLQYIVEGKEQIAIANINTMKVVEAYNKEGDYELFSGEVTELKTLSEKDFILLSPHEVHQPGIVINNTIQKIKKIVVKALI
ncbi:MAG: YhcH/YjgK/YiaL family protein [Oceanihabitans sp.]